MKLCPRCGLERSVEEFGRNADRPDGLALYCKPCFRVVSRESYRRRVERSGRQLREKVSVPPGMKRCPSCAEVKPIADFPKNRASSDGLGTYCKPCHNVITRTNIAKNHGNSRHYHLRRRYGIGADEVERMLDAQGWACVICTAELTVKNAQVDHDHATGAVRGILCFNCNGGLGQFKDDLASLRRAAAYLGRHSADPWERAAALPSVVEREWGRALSLEGYGHAS